MHAKEGMLFSGSWFDYNQRASFYEEGIIVLPINSGKVLVDANASTEGTVLPSGSSSLPPIVGNSGAVTT